ncbi:MAG: phage tail protein [Bacteroides sp.]|nr:phage tail protein [Bacteroides sp.]MCM1448292.1 phage tail protein [Bacteroides sp.]
MEKLQGTHLILGYQDEEGEFHAFAYARSCEIKQKSDTVEVASPSSGRWKEFIFGRCEWTATCECLLSDDESETERRFREGLPVTVCLRTRGKSGDMYKGEAIITSLSLSGRLHEMAGYTIGLKGTGELEYV